MTRAIDGMTRAIDEVRSWSVEDDLRMNIGLLRGLDLSLPRVE